MAASTALGSFATKANTLFLGVCLPCLKHNASKFSIRQMELDKKLLMYFDKEIVLYAYDPKKICKTGDIVLIQELSKKMTPLITHKVLEIIYPCGDVTDPVTGKKVIGGLYREDIEKENLMFGKEKNTFNYNTAPKRGWQEGKKDFSHRDIYLRYHEFDEGDENKDQPNSNFYV